MQRGDFQWLGALLAGVVLGALSIYWFIEPMPLFNTFCVQQPCSIGIIAASLVLVLGISLLTAGVVMFARSRQAQTVTIAMNDQAEADAEAIGVLEDAVEHKKSPEKKLAGKVGSEPKKRIDLEEFIELPKEELKLKKVKR